MWSAGTNDLNLGPGLHEIVYSISSLPLRPGAYRWHVSIFDRDRFIDNLDCVPLLSVETPPLGHPQDAYQGVLNIPYRVDFRRVPAPSELTPAPVPPAPDEHAVAHSGSTRASAR
jgi:hypothetical protein